MNIPKASAWYLLFMAALHTLVGFMLDMEPLKAMLLDGVGTMDQPHEDRLSALWFMFSGVLMFILAGFAFWAANRLGELPRFLGYVFVPLGLVGGYIIPVSGLWLYIPVGFALILHRPRAVPSAI